MWRLDIRDRSGLRFASENRAAHRSPESSVVPNIKSAEKNMRKSRAAAVRNRAQRSALRTALKKASDPQASADARRNAVSLLDRAARKGLIHRNTAARYKSRLAKVSK
jgi:small subunit ribosomal protein S20